MITYAFIDAANLFHDWEKRMGWKIDHQKLLAHLKSQYGVEVAFYFSGVEMHKTGEASFYQQLKAIGYTLQLKPVKYYRQKDGYIKKKANCDVDMTFLLMKEMNKFDQLIFLSGDGDFLPVLQYLRDSNKKIIIIARQKKTASNILKFSGKNFINFDLLADSLKVKTPEKP